MIAMDDSNTHRRSTGDYHPDETCTTYWVISDYGRLDDWDTLNIIPNSWMWYDVFRTWIDIELLSMIIITNNLMMRTQEPISKTLRAKQKRKMHVQKLRAI